MPPSPELPPLIDVIRFHELAAKKSLGQHFLLDETLLARIVRAAGDLSGRHVLEIGPGPGGLTRALLATQAASVTAIEKDRRCIAALGQLKEIHGERFLLLEADAMAVELKTVGTVPRAVVANLPYNIGTALVADWLSQVAQEGAGLLESFTVLLQKEVAERLVAPPGSKAYGRLSVLMRQFTESHLAFDIPPGAFSPPPKVTSSLVVARILPQPREEVPLATLEKVVAAAFGQRRKMLRQSLKTLGVDAQQLCAAANIDPTERPEQCDLAAFAALTRAYIRLR